MASPRFGRPPIVVTQDDFLFPYALWRDLVSDAPLTTLPTTAKKRFHTPYGVTSFRTAGNKFDVDSELLCFHTPYGVTSFRTCRVRLSARRAALVSIRLMA